MRSRPGVSSRWRSPAQEKAEEDERLGREEVRLGTAHARPEGRGLPLRRGLQGVPRRSRARRRPRPARSSGWQRRRASRSSRDADAGQARARSSVRQRPRPGPHPRRLGSEPLDLRVAPGRHAPRQPPHRPEGAAGLRRRRVRALQHDLLRRHQEVPVGQSARSRSSGRVDTTDGKRVDVSIGLKDGDPVFVIADNAPHSDKPLRDRKYDGGLHGRGARSGRRQRARRGLLGRRAGARGADFDLRDPRGGLRLRGARARARRRAPADVGIDRGLVGRLRAGRPPLLLLRGAGAPRPPGNAEEDGARLPLQLRGGRLGQQHGRGLAVLQLDAREARRGRARREVHGPRPARGAAALRGRLGRRQRRHQPALPADERSDQRRAPRVRRHDQDATAPASTPTPSSSRGSAGFWTGTAIAWQTQTPKVDGIPAARSAGSSPRGTWRSSTSACRCCRCTRPSRCPRRSTSGASTGSWRRSSRS